jgi:hypothetical protein
MITILFLMRTESAKEKNDGQMELLDMGREKFEGDDEVFNECQLVRVTRHFNAKSSKSIS